MGYSGMYSGRVLGEGLNVLVVGSGGREHALAWKISQSALVGKLYAAPGNPGMAKIARCFDVKVTDVEGMAALADTVDADLVVIGPEVPLSLGLADKLAEKGRLAFGPVKACARLESSKAFSKEVMFKAGVPTAWAKVFDTPEDADIELSGMSGPVVVKLDGLAAGKGVVVCDTRAEAKLAVSRLSRMHPGGRILLEEKLEGFETSLLCICDGLRALPLMPAKDYKRALDGDLGPNTGGMGAVAPSPFLDLGDSYDLVKATVLPILKEMAAMGTAYKGVLYVGLMLTKEGPKVLEYNCRFGDPETQAVMPLMEDDLLEVMMEAAKGELRRERLVFKPGACVSVVLASKGYPEMFDKGFAIELPEEADDDVVIFHAGTAVDTMCKLVTDGGRVLNISAVGSSIPDATKKAYRAAGTVKCANLTMRKDIGLSRK